MLTVEEYIKICNEKDLIPTPKCKCGESTYRIPQSINFNYNDYGCDPHEGEYDKHKEYFVCLNKECSRHMKRYYDQELKKEVLSGKEEKERQYQELIKD